MSKNRTIASLISNDTSKIKTVYTDSDSIVTSASLGVTAAAGTATYSSADTLPVSANNGDQALVTSTNRLYIFTNGGWYNIALVNTSPYFTTSPNASYELSTTGAQTNIEILAVDSEGINITYSTVADSDFSTFATITKDSDNGRRFTITVDSDQSVGATGTVTFKASDGVNIASALSTFSVEFIVTNSNYTVLLLKADSDGTDNQVDASTIGRTLTEAGNVTSTAFTPYHPGGYSTYFDGTGDYLSVTYNSNLDLTQTSTATIEAWIYLPAVPSGNKAIITNRPIGVPNEGMDLRLTSSRTIQYYETGAGSVSGSTVIPLNTWTHVAVVKTGGNVYVYINGTLDNSGSFTNGSSGSNPTLIGRNGGSVADEYINAYIKDLRVVNGTAVYTSSFTPPTEPLTAITNTVLLACHLPYIAISGQTITIYGNTSTKRFGPYDYLGYTKAEYGGSVYFDGTDDNLSFASSADFNFGSSDWTIEAWLYQTARDASNVCRWYMSGTNGSGNAIHVSINPNGTLDCGRAVGGGVITGTSTEAMPLNTWNHVVATKEGSNGYLYLNGKQVSTSGSATEQTSGDISLRIGYDTVATVDEQFTGYMSDLQVIKGRRKYKAAFTPPTLPMTADSDAVLFTCTNKNDIWDASTGKLLTKAGNTTASNTQRKFAASSAVYLDGTGDYLYSPNSTDFDIAGDLSWTIEGWFYWNSISGEQTMVEKFTGGTGPGWSLYIFNSGSIGFYSGSNGAFSNTIHTVTTGQWYHVAVSRDATTDKTRAFVDGVLKVDSTYSVGNNSSGNLYIGTRNGSSNYMNGYVQDVRITKGLARYTGTFTPPTSEFNG